MGYVKFNTFICFIAFSMSLVVSLFSGEAAHPAMPIFMIGYMVQAAILAAVKELKR